MGTDPTPPDTPGTDTPEPDAGGTEPAPVTPPAESDNSERQQTDLPPEESDLRDNDASLDDERRAADEGLGEPLGQRTTLADDAAPAGHLTTDPETGVSRQHGDVNPELGQAPDTLAGTAQPRGDQASEGLTEPEQIETDRPDVGTPVSDESPAPLDTEED